MCHNHVPTFVEVLSVFMRFPGSLQKVGTKESADSSMLVLLLLGGRYPSLETLLQQNGYKVIATPAPDNGVAVCLHNRILAALIDEEFLADADTWSLAESLKAVSPNTSIVLLVRGSAAKGYPLRGVDYIVNDREAEQVLNALKKCVPV